MTGASQERRVPAHSGRARYVAEVVLNLSMLGVVVAGVWLLAAAALYDPTQPNQGFLLSLQPVTLRLQLGQQVYEIARAGVWDAAAPSVTNFLIFTRLLFLVAVWWLLWRLKHLAIRLLDDPFALRNARDLRAAAWLGVAMQCGVWFWPWVRPLILPGQWSPDDLRRALAPVADVSVTAERTVTLWGVGFNVFGINVTWLFVAAMLAILANAFQRGHDLREEERCLRQEQELTV